MTTLVTIFLYTQNEITAFLATRRHLTLTRRRDFHSPFTALFTCNFV